MGGFKEGTVDGWDEGDDGTEPETEPVAEETGGDTAESDSPVADADGETDTGTEASKASVSDIPWILRRNSITDGREQTVQLHLQEETMDVQRTQKSVIERRLGERVRKADLREAALLVGLQRTDDVVEVLKEWGYALD